MPLTEPLDPYGQGSLGLPMYRHLELLLLNCPCSTLDDAYSCKDICDDDDM